LGLAYSLAEPYWATYWANQSEVLFIGLYSDISGGQMPNRKSGSSDYLTVAGAVGSETYQCPNTAPYIAADTDYIWFKTDVSQRTTTTAELIGYDFTRTIVKYANASPHAIEAIMILSSDYVTDKMRDDFMLSIWWDNTLSAHGNLKGNRGSEQSVWLKYTKLLSHFDGDNDATEYSDLVAGAFTFTGGAKLSTTQKKFGATALSVLTAGHVKVPYSANYNLGAGDFTIDFWYYPVTAGALASSFMCAQCDAAATASKRQSSICAVITSRKLRFYFWDDSANILTSSDSTTAFKNNSAWYHIAVVRNGNTITGYINGVPECTLDVTGKTLQSSDQDFVIGNLGVYVGDTYAKGYIDEFRLSKGIARWTADFSASLPSAAYTHDHTD
jgi:hypothetical protein